MAPPDNHTHDFTSHPFIKVIDRNQAAAALERSTERPPGLDAFGLGVDVGEADFEVFGTIMNEASA
jgi:hypothetical protein